MPELYDFLSAPWWAGVGTLALVMTLIFVIKYTRATNRLAETTASMLRLEHESIGLRMRPTIRVTCNDQKRFPFEVRVENLSPVHALVRIKVTVDVDGECLESPKDSDYGGKNILQLQAKSIYAFFLNFQGLPWWTGAPDTKPRSNRHDVRVTLEAWSINFYLSDTGLYDNGNRIPTTVFSWEDRYWQPEVLRQENPE